MSLPLREFDVVVIACSVIAQDALRIDFAREDGDAFPFWAPGSHVDLLLPGGMERQYSLCGDPDDAHAWTVVVLKESSGRGGSAWLHATVHPGMVLAVRGPSNHFELESADRYRFIAAGIGITAILPMVRSTERSGKEWRLDYAVRSADRMAFKTELGAWGADRVTTHVGDEGRRLDVDSVRPEPGELIYACGPARLLNALAAQSENWGANVLRLERFGAVEPGTPVRSDSFKVELVVSGNTLEVQPEESILDVVERAGVFVLSSCREGTCGTCETTVLGGAVDHRDSILTAAERRADDRMMICVSRASSESLQLEL